MKNILFAIAAAALALVLPMVLDASHLNMVILVLMAAQLGLSLIHI